ncbi:hypothetical protein [Companilactobacillus ginsenosidimutans]|uniref:Uncharacterized protein n=1 Tax=Companilactobacillus ginsenosidimutans TaxID=1007676 RepID=A0A0H4R0I8_9LACO|nr:hypothetical protein [Companilactobacillus ginsenosidimutans]AKP67240.1 hypothetical protein ABM34_06605 [Companilactobacillus ginsenosidimutans]
MEKLYIHEDFVIDNNMIAVIATDDCDYGKSIVIHNKLGVFFVDRTTKELMNEYHDEFSFGFEISRTIAKENGMRGLLPLVNGKNVYMPLSGKRGGSPDWIGLHFLEDAKQYANYAVFTTESGIKIALSYTKIDLNRQVHDACLISELHLRMIQIFSQQFGRFTLFEENVGLTDKYNHCECKYHLKLPTSWRQMMRYIDNHQYYLAYQMSFFDIGNTKEQGARMKMGIIRKMNHW